MNENKVIPLRVMFFASLLFGFLASTIQDVYFKNLEGNMFIQWQENAFYIARLFCVVFAFFTIYISYTFTNLPFNPINICLKNQLPNGTLRFSQKLFSSNSFFNFI